MKNLNELKLERYPYIAPDLIDMLLAILGNKVVDEETDEMKYMDLDGDYDGFTEYEKKLLLDEVATVPFANKTIDAFKTDMNEWHRREQKRIDRELRLLDKEVQKIMTKPYNKK